MKKFSVNTKIYWCGRCGYISQRREKSRTSDKLSNELCQNCKINLWEYEMDVSEEINFLRYNLENCEIALDRLKEINKKLQLAMCPGSAEDPLELGQYNRIVQDYLIIKVAGLFDEDTRTISFYNLLDNTDAVDKLEKEDIIKYIREKRDRICAHHDRDYIRGEDNVFPNTQKIVNSNLGKTLSDLRIILDGLKNINNLKTN